MRKVCSIILLIVVAALIGCRSSQPELTDEQKQLADDLKDVTKEYLADKVGIVGFGGKVYCAHKVLDVEMSGEIVNEYVYAVCQEYYPRNGELQQGTGTGMPVALLIKKQDTTYQVISHRIPGDGARYASDVERIFPKRIHDAIFYSVHEENFWQAEVEREAKEHDGIR